MPRSRRRSAPYLIDITPVNLSFDTEPSTTWVRNDNLPVFEYTQDNFEHIYENLMRNVRGNLSYPDYRLDCLRPEPGPWTISRPTESLQDLVYHFNIGESLEQTDGYPIRNILGLRTAVHEETNRKPKKKKCLDNPEYLIIEGLRVFYEKGTFSYVLNGEERIGLQFDASYLEFPNQEDGHLVVRVVYPLNGNKMQIIEVFLAKVHTAQVNKDTVCTYYVYFKEEKLND